MIYSMYNTSANTSTIAAIPVTIGQSFFEYPQTV